MSEDSPTVTATEFRRKDCFQASDCSGTGEPAQTTSMKVVHVFMPGKTGYQKEEVGLDQIQMCLSHNFALFHNKICSYF